MALVTDQGAVTFTDLATLAARAASALARLPAGPVAFVARSDVPTVALVLALFATGRTMVPLHPRWTQAEQTAALATLVDSMIVVDPVELSTQARTDASAALEPRSHDDEAIAAVLFTSGSSGRPKAVLLPRRAFLASAAAHANNLPFVPDDRWLLAMPLAHAGGLSILTRSILARTAVVLIAGFDPDEVLATTFRERVTLLSVVPAMLHRLLERDRANVLARTRAVLVGGAAFPMALRAGAYTAKVPVLATYGLTETCSQVVTERPGDRRATDPRAVGRPLDGVEIEIRSQDGRPAPRGTAGRIWVRGAMVMRGYAGAPPLAVGEALDTGDEGRFDAEGVLSVIGRADETIITGGENVHPNEVEATLLAAPGVREAAVFGVPDPIWGQVVAAALVVENDEAAGLACIEASRSLASFKRPRLVAVLPELPRLPNGKLDRRALSALAPERFTAAPRG
ncbi:MAG: AMP-binding protein [Polyangiaceae bacterium]|nr:AMP-binding protein [Polyangiaceae bacterium]